MSGASVHLRTSEEYWLQKNAPCWAQMYGGACFTGVPVLGDAKSFCPNVILFFPNNVQKVLMLRIKRTIVSKSRCLPV